VHDAVLLFGLVLNLVLGLRWFLFEWMVLCLLGTVVERNQSGSKSDSAGSQPAPAESKHSTLSTI